jgi:asparagine synthase (glutamine-hydrolysing)
VSGIYGIYRYDGAPADPRWLEKMRAGMAYYGPDGGGASIVGPVGLGHLLLEVNPEDSYESQPVSGERGPVISAARLDNRAELLDTFHLASVDAPQVSDGHLVSLAFDRWGEEVSSHLQGDWSLAAWNPRERRLLLARDACGSATLYYHEGKGFIAFASSLKALLALPDVRKEPDASRLAEVLVAWQPDAELTAYKGFIRLIWAHAMTVDAQGKSRTWRHWSPVGREPHFFRQDSEYVEAFLEHYQRAVQSCLRSKKPIAATLSGGRDSGSVVALAAPLLARQERGLTAYTSVPSLSPDGAASSRLGNEWELSRTAATMAGRNVAHLPIDAAGYGVLQGIEHFLDAHDGPSHAAGNNYWFQAILDAASRNGYSSLLTGQMGNATVSWTGNGSSLLALLQGHPSPALQLLLHAEPDLWLTLKRQLLKPLLTPGLRAYRNLKAPRGRSWQSYSALNSSMASMLKLDDQMRAAKYDSSFTFSPLEDMRLRFFQPMWGIALGLGSELGAKHSLSMLDPTINQALVEFVLRVPDSQFRHQGQASWLFKRAFQYSLPESVVFSKQKGLQAADVGHRILLELPVFRAQLDALDSLPEARQFLDLGLMHRCLRNLVAEVNPETTGKASQILLRGLGVGIFLRRLADTSS